MTRKSTKHKINLMKLLYRKYGSYNYVAKKLGIHHTTVLYWMKRLKNKKPKYQYKTRKTKVSTEDYKVMIMTNVDADTKNPKEIGKQLRKEFYQDFGFYPEEVK